MPRRDKATGDRIAVRALLDELVRAGEIEAVGERRWRRWVARAE